MKKLFSLMAIAAVALTSFTSCDENEPDTPPVAKAKLTLSADANVAVEATGKFTVTSNIDATSDIAITVKSSDEKILTITTASVTIANGKKSVEGSFKGIANGKAKITIEATGVTLSVSSVNVTVGEAPAADKILITTVSMEEGFGQIEYPSSDIKDSDVRQVGGLWVNKYAWGDATGTSPERTSVENYGCRAVGSLSGKAIRLAIVAKDVEINSSLAWVENTERGSDAMGWNTDIAPNWTMAPDIYITDSYTDNAEKSGYIVCEFMYSNTDAGIVEKIYPAWIEVSVDANGTVTFGEVALCLDGSFKTGQKQ